MLKRLNFTSRYDGIHALRMLVLVIDLNIRFARFKFFQSFVHYALNPNSKCFLYYIRAYLLLGASPFWHMRKTSPNTASGLAFHGLAQSTGELLALTSELNTLACRTNELWLQFLSNIHLSYHSKTIPLCSVPSRDEKDGFPSADSS